MRLKGLFYIFIPVFLFCSLMLHALNPNKALTQYRLDSWNIENGFPHNLVYTIIQTRDGYIWMGTRNGLVRFNGFGFKTFQKENESQLKSNDIRCLLEDNDGTIWIGNFNGGLSYLKEGNFQNYSSEKYPFLEGIYCMTQSNDGAIWIGTLQNGIISLKDGKFTNYTCKDGLVSDKIINVVKDIQGNLWFATRSGLIKKNPNNSFINYTTKNGLPGEFVFSVLPDKKGGLWISSFSKLCYYKNDTFTPIDTASILKNPKIVPLYLDSNDYLWIGTDGNGFTRMKNGAFDRLSTDIGIESKCISCFLEDREGSLWIGTVHEGALRLSDTKFANLTTREGLSTNITHCIFQDHAGDLWIGTDYGLNKIKKGKCTLEFTTKNGLFHNTVYTVIEDRKNNIWIGTNRGLNIYNLKNKSISGFTYTNGLNNNVVTSLYEDRSGRIWIGTEGGLNKYENGKITNYSEKDGINSELVCSIIEDRNGILWIGTSIGVFHTLSPTDKQFKLIPASSNIYVNNLYEDKNGMILIGTGKGLIIYNNGNTIHCTNTQGLGQPTVESIIEDDLENIWMGGKDGISRIKRKDFDDFIEQKSNYIPSLVYNEGDGMKTRWCKNSVVINKDGKIWFATDKGAVILYPEDISKITKKPPVYIEEILVNGRIFDCGNIRKSDYKAIIPAGTDRIEFFYTALSFLNHQKVKFKIKMDGYDREWINAGSIHNTTYTSLSPGNYTFRVIACNSEGIWNKIGAEYRFYLEPYFYQTAWFFRIVGILVIALIYIGYRWRMKQLIANEKKLSRLVIERTEALDKRTQELADSYRIIEEKNQNILASIEYASNIQKAMLPVEKRMDTFLKDYFVIFNPKDIVSGDFYWFHEIGEFLFIAVADCTGHGVPGALLSMIGGMKLHELINDRQILDPAQILSQLHFSVRSILKQGKDSQSHDGMDIGLCRLDIKNKTIVFAGAKRPLYYIKNSQFFEIKGERKSIGGLQKEKERLFVNYVVKWESEITFYLTTDGFSDQNNPGDQKYGTKRLKQYIKSISPMEMTQQKQVLFEEFQRHKSYIEQRDDIIIIGIRLNA